MESEILKVQLIQPWYQYIIQFIVTFIPSILVGTGLYFLLRKSRRKEAFEFEKKNRAFKDMEKIIDNFKHLLHNLYEAIEMGYRKLTFDEFKDINMVDIIRDRNRELKRYYEENINIFTNELAQKLSILNKPVVKGFIIRLEEKRKGKKDFEVSDVFIDYQNFITARDDFLDALQKQANLLLS